MSPPQQGHVATFDDHVGLGAITSRGGTEYPFHCTQIADGTRTIAVGTAVEFGLAAGHRGRWEAIEVRPLT